MVRTMVQPWSMVQPMAGWYMVHGPEQLRFKLIPLYKRSHAADRIQEWIRDMRANPLYSNMPGGYKVVSNIRTDSAGEWEMENEEWTEMA